MPGLGDSPWLIVGLGNPGTKYENTRHNVGFKVIDELARRWRAAPFSAKHSSLFVQIDEVPGLGRGKLFLVKPQTFMNLSGQSVSEWVRYSGFKDHSQLLVIYDELDLPQGVLRLRLSGSAGGHNGMKSILEATQTEQFPRLRVGIGRNTLGEVSDYVLRAPRTAEERAVFEGSVQRAADAVELCLKEGVAKAMNTVNQKAKGTE